MLRRRQTIRTVLVVAPLLFLSTSCYSPLQITWDDHQPVLSPQESQRLLQPQGLLIVEAIKLSGIMQRVQVPLLEILDTSGGRRSLIHG
jgi:hypothetical protein